MRTDLSGCVTVINKDLVKTNTGKFVKNYNFNGDEVGEGEFSCARHSFFGDRNVYELLYNRLGILYKDNKDYHEESKRHVRDIAQSPYTFVVCDKYQFERYLGYLKTKNPNYLVGI